MGEDSFNHVSVKPIILEEWLILLRYIFVLSKLRGKLLQLKCTNENKFEYSSSLYSTMATDLHTMGIMSKIRRISCTLSGAFCTVRIHVNSKDFRKVLESYSVYVWEGVEIKMTTDKWTSEIDLSFGIKLAESQLCNLSWKLISVCYNFLFRNSSFWTLYDSNLVPDWYTCCLIVFSSHIHSSITSLYHIWKLDCRKY